MIIDVHGHLGNINQAPFWSANGDQLESYCDQAGVDLLCISSSRSLMYDAAEGNAELDLALQKSKKLMGYVVVNPVFSKTEKELRLLQENPKFCGVKIHPDYHGFDMASRSVVRFLDRIAEQTKMMLFHVSCMPGTGFADPLRIARFAERHPRTNFILAHMGGIFQNANYPYYPNFQGCEDVAALNLKNVYLDTAHHLMYVYPGVMERMVEIVGAEQIVFGTDVPLQGPMQMRFAIEVIQTMKASSEEKEKILGGNAKKILGLQ
jgi:predicted TIM-barrel fold metal-dependent hydrolase